jgi:hypothetical protein
LWNLLLKRGIVYDFYAYHGKPRVPLAVPLVVPLVAGSATRLRADTGGKMGSRSNYMNFTSFVLPTTYSVNSGRAPVGPRALRVFALKI